MNKIKYFVVVLLCLFIVGCTNSDVTSDKIKIVSTMFPGYDFARAITGDMADLNMLIKPGVEVHTYDPSPRDIINIKSSDIFIYVGGESEEWVDDILGEIDTNKTKVIRLMDYVNLVQEELKEGMQEEEESEEEEEEYDEHIWTSPLNEIKIINYLKDEIIKLDPDNKKIYEENANNYIKELDEIDTEFREIVKNGKRTTIVFGDRFPLRYFVDEYGLDYYAAFPGCAEQTEASAKTISFLIDKVKREDIPVVFKIELSNGKIADTIASESNAKVLEFHTAHNISLKDFNDGITYVDIMRKNIKVLKEALN